MENQMSEGTTFKFNVTLDKRIPNERMIATVLAGVPGKRRGDLVRTLLLEGLAYRQAARSNGLVIAPPVVTQASSAEVAAFAEEEVESPIKKDLF